MLPVFRSRLGLWILRVAIGLPLILALGFAIYELGDCTLGLNSPGGCALIPDWVGMVAFFTAVAAYVIGIYISPFLVVTALIMEFLTRRMRG